MPKSVHLMALGIFAMVTSEFLVGGLMPQIADDLHVGIAQVGYLITAFALAMALGGPFATVAVLRLRPKTALMTLFAVFLAGNVLAAAATGYGVMLAARLVTGTASAAFFGVSLSVVAQITSPEVRGRAIGVAMQGLMVGTLLGLPLSTLVGQQWGWRAGFVAVGAITVLAAVATAVAVPSLEHADGAGDFRDELTVFRNGRLWLVLCTSMLVIGATFAAFSYFTPILTEVTGFSRGTVPLLLLGYGAATVVGNTVVARLADSHTIRVLVTGLALNAVFLTAFALLADLKAPAVAAMTGIGLVGVTLNPAMISRVQRTANARPLVNTVHSSFITLGVVIGSGLGGAATDSYGLRAPLWLGAGTAVLGLLTLIPDVVRVARVRVPKAA
ncbi:MFS transporter [Streptomyces morookaense]|uniref:MFS transporter n=1 Tax=Streptomyces morookaense TaxID=1970 RepID=A0A7Y7B6M4_STRMO|nr:MFS transporter [Streptomyces morookaense]NVK80008.1 MFS transporter [Streptomyces morookaense]GHF41367.1 MFS transporter [Streptomyces morookaense]